MGCQHKIAEQIIRKEGDYVFSLKGNQEKLCEDVKNYFETIVYSPTSNHSSIHDDYDKGHGRIESRKCWVSTDVDWLVSRYPQEKLKEKYL